MKTEVTVYRLKNDETPLAKRIQTAHTHRRPLLYWDKDKDESRALRLASNQKSFYEDEQKGQVIMQQIWFDDGEYRVPQNRPTIRHFLDIHPDNIANGGNVFYKVDFEAMAVHREEMLDVKFEAEYAARNRSIEDLRFAMTDSEWKGSAANKMSDDDVRREAKNVARTNPEYFLDVLGEPQESTNDDKIDLLLQANVIQIRRNGGVHYNLPDNKSRIIAYNTEEEDPKEVLKHYLMYDKEGLEIYKSLMQYLD